MPVGAVGPIILPEVFFDGHQNRRLALGVNLALEERRNASQPPDYSVVVLAICLSDALAIVLLSPDVATDLAGGVVWMRTVTGEIVLPASQDPILSIF